MFSSLSRRYGARLLDRLDLVVELSTLGEYGLDQEGLFPLEDGIPARPGPPAIARKRDDCPPGARVSRACRDAAARP